MKFWIFWGLLVTFVSIRETEFQCKKWPFDNFCQNYAENQTFRQECNDTSQDDFFPQRCAMESFMCTCEDGLYDDFPSDINKVENVLEETNVETSALLCGDDYMALMYIIDGTFEGVEFHSDNNMSVTDHRNADTIVSAYLPKSLDIDEEDKIIFCILQLPNGTAQNSTYELYEQRMVGLSVANKSISGLSERVNLTMRFSLAPNKSAEPLCVFLNYSSGNWSSNGCLTLWDDDQHQVTCSCDHLTYFGVLLVLSTPSPEHQQILSYITLIGCGISLTALVFTVFLFFTHSKIRADDSRKIHINLVFALILLNLHLLPNEKVATSSLPGLCLYMALALHYSLLATFSWMALEGFHLYLLIVKVFNIHTNRYLLKISVIGWGVPAVIVSIVVSIKKEYYGLSTLNNSSLCYITDGTVKQVTVMGLFGLLFVFNTVMFSITVRHLITSRHQNNFGPMKKNRTKDMGLLLFLITLLGIAWGFIFFSFGPLVTPALYIFCILNSLQGFFIFIYFVLTLRKIKDPTTTGNKTNSLNT
ncbi:G-protein coupled receptor 64 [Oryzias melastigma]|uniref:G-protein coupled receptor 64 n=1 Tax=Oryzias melastigma TaxID=30732 RepID=A0A834FRL3_ORYME|nr:G-protein coupled receptor 64 [Oryzias melastigma]